MRSTLLLAALVLGACNPEISIAPDKNIVGAGEAPDLLTPTKTDRIVQVTKPRVDILWVIDDSCSMIEEQNKLAENFGSFITFFLDSGLDWHIGVVSTDTEDNSKNGKLQGAGGYRYIDALTPNPIGVFGQMTRLGTNGAYTERGLLAAYRALSQPSDAIRQANRNFYRDDAALHVIAISDEEDQSPPQLNRNEFITFMNDLKEDEDTPVTFSSIVGPLPSGCHNSETDASAGSSYIAVTNAVGGIFESICEEDWVPLLEELGLQAAGLRREYFLSEIPVPGSIEVWVIDGDDYYDGVDGSNISPRHTLKDACDEIEGTRCFPYTYNAQRNSIIMSDFVPSPLAEVNIKYKLLRGLQPEEAGDLLDNPQGIDTGASE